MAFAGRSVVGGLGPSCDEETFRHHRSRNQQEQGNYCHCSSSVPEHWADSQLLIQFLKSKPLRNETEGEESDHGCDNVASKKQRRNCNDGVNNLIECHFVFGHRFCSDLLSVITATITGPRRSTCKLKNPRGPRLRVHRIVITRRCAGRLVFRYRPEVARIT